jgi:hypothetical protein
VAYWFPPDLTENLERNAIREGRARVPEVGLYAILKRPRRPTRADRFDRLYTVSFNGAGGFDVQPMDEQD